MKDTKKYKLKRKEESINGRIEEKINENQTRIKINNNDREHE